MYESWMYCTTICHKKIKAKEEHKKADISANENDFNIFI